MLKISKIGAPVALLLAGSMALAGCAANEQTGGSTTSGSSLSGTLTGKGASSMKAAQEKWTADFQTANTGVTVNYSPDGSGAGREAFVSGAANFAGSDRALKDSEMGAGKFAGCAASSSALNLPVYISPIAVVFKVDGVTDLKLDADTLAGIFAGTITKWDDAKIKALNPDAGLPSANITAVHRSDDSGTTQNFTEYLSAVAPSVWTKDPDGQWPFPGGEAAKGTSGVIDAVTNGTNTIGYADESAAQNLSKAQIKVGDEFLSPTAEAAAKIVDQSSRVDGRADNDWALNLDRKAAGVYPIVLVSYAIVCEEYKDASVATLVKAYVGYIVSADGQAAGQSAAGSAPLSADMQSKLKTAVDSIK
ncbi:phosphate ABC transporter substrate-binding protein PstS [Propionicicella superfundia]|uniref:phosphate ABC transporter substrate-binding protein PstS n=1 Tax=Propionicicella superfundia TaxID=348582 RepID=UPI00041835FC|nr:phosphate ABC transporter substrate-binding protein PstS [Propionicicella superfundia]